MIKPNAGDFVVAEARWENAAVRKVTKVSASVYYFNDDYYNRQRRGSLAEILFAGPEDVALLLSERLKSSQAQCQDDCNKARIRQQNRDIEFIKQASSPLPSRQCNSEGK